MGKAAGMTDREAMQAALALARTACAHGDVPVGALVLDSSRHVIGQGCNRRQIEGDPLAHAEVVALVEATRHQAETLRNRAAHRRVLAANGNSRACARPDAEAQVGSPDNPDSTWNLEGCTLVVTLEPCPMCTGAAVQTHIDRIVFGAWDPKMGACGSVWDIPRDPHIGHHAQVTGGVLEQDSEALLRDFFTARRAKAVDCEL